MSDGSSDCGVNDKPEKTQDKNSFSLASRRFERRMKKSKNSEAEFDSSDVTREAVQALVNQTERNDTSNTLFVANERSEFPKGTTEPGIHRVLTNGLVSILASIRVIPSFARRPETSSPSIDQLAEASTSSETRRSILREKDFSALNDESNRFSRIKQFWERYPTKETKKAIIFVDQRISDSSMESVVTLIGTSKPLLKSALRSTGSLRSASSSVRFSLPPETPRTKGNESMKIGNWKIVCDFGNDEITEGRISTWRSLSHTRICKLVMCLTVGLILPSFLVVPVLVYEETLKDATV